MITRINQKVIVTRQCFLKILSEIKWTTFAVTGIPQCVCSPLLWESEYRVSEPPVWGSIILCFTDTKFYMVYNTAAIYIYIHRLICYHCCLWCLVSGDAATPSVSHMGLYSKPGYLLHIMCKIRTYISFPFSSLSSDHHSRPTVSNIHVTSLKHVA